MNAEKRWTDDVLLAVADVVCEGAVMRAVGCAANACPYPEETKARNVWQYGWWRANAVLSTDFDEEASACFEEAA